jgi:hypothetical protein
MNSPHRRRRCQHCRQGFFPDYRNAYHQRFCPSAACQHASKRASQRKWLRKPENRGYFREPDNLDRIRDWRRLHPDYWRTVKHRCQEPAEPHPAPAPELEEISGQARTLQDLCQEKIPVFTELISRLSGCALQEDIARLAAQVVKEAQCILVRCQQTISSHGQSEPAVNYHESG